MRSDLSSPCLVWGKAGLQAALLKDKKRHNGRFFRFGTVLGCSIRCERREYPKKHSSKEVTAYKQVLYHEMRRLLRRYSQDKAPSGALRLPTERPPICGTDSSTYHQSKLKC